MQTQRARFDGWKEISSELGVSERTARRYEARERLPVHRHMHETRGSVYAWSDELESWKQSRSTIAATVLHAKSLNERYSNSTENSTKHEGTATQNAHWWEDRITQHLPLIGRDREYNLALRALEATRLGCGSVIVIGGEPGVGKTHFIETVLAEAARRDCFGVTGQCRDMEVALPYVAFCEILEQVERFTPRNAFRKLLGNSAVEISQVTPGLRQIFADIPLPIQVPPDQQRRLLFNAWRDFFERSAHSQPMVAVFEDLQWADEATLLLFSHLAQSVSTMSLLLVGTYRTVEADMSRPFTGFLERCFRDKSATRLFLRRLSMPEVAALLGQLSGQIPPEQFVSFIFDRTEGNPFFVEELFLELQARDRLYDEHGVWCRAFRNDELNVPQGVRLLIGRRLNRLEEYTRQVLRLAAVLGRSFSVGLLENLETDEPEAVLGALEEAERAYLIEADQAERKPTYRFIHELVRQTLLESLSLTRRQRLHARVAGTIAQVSAANLESHASTLAHHCYEAGSTVDAEQTVGYLLMAARVATAGAAHEDALSHLEKAFLLAQNERCPNTAEVMALKAAVLRSLSRMDEAIDAYEQAIDLFRVAGRLADAAEASHALGHIHLWRADPGRALAVADRALMAIGTRAPLARYRIEFLKAISLGIRGEMEAAFAALAKAKQMEPALPENSSDVIGYARMCEAHICYFAARMKQAAECGRAAIAEFRATGNVWAEVETYEVMSEVISEAQSTEEIQIVLSDAVLRAQRIGHQNATWTYRFMSAELLMHQGELERAECAAREVHNFAMVISAPWAFLDYVLLAAIAHYRGQFEDAAQWSRKGLELEPDCYMSGQLNGSLYWNLAAKGDPEAEYALGIARQHLPFAGKILTIGSSSCLAFVVEGLAIAGRIQEAAALEESAEWVVANAPSWLYSRHLFRTSAGIAAACARNWTRAEEHHRTALHIADSTGCRVAQPVSRYWYADMLCSRDLPGDRQQACKLLSEALHLAESMEMVWQARRAAQRLASMYDHRH